MLTINYNSINDIGPEHGQIVVVLSKSKYFDSNQISTTIVEVVLEWIQYDDKGYTTGVSLTFDTLSNYIVGDTFQDCNNPLLTFQLEWSNSSSYLYWIDLDDYEKIILNKNI